MDILKPEDVMKALECCIEDGYFQECFLKDFEGISVEDVLKAAITLLREMDAEIKGLVDGWSKDQDHFEKMVEDTISI